MPAADNNSNLQLLGSNFIIRIPHCSPPLLGSSLLIAPPDKKVHHQQASYSRGN
jgi:hypothetical protein